MIYNIKGGEKMVGIYKIENLVTHNVYIGQSINIEKRIKKHKTVAFNPEDKAYEYPLYRAIRKYGLDNFSFEILEECDQIQLNEQEKKWIEKYNSFFNGYNQTLGGDSSRNIAPKESIIGIIQDLEITKMTQKEIGKKWNISEEMVQGINTGRYWFHNRQYPIREQKKVVKKYCIDCGKEIFKSSTRCIFCEAKRRSEMNILPISREELKQLIRIYPFTKIGKKYGVSDNTIRKWCDKYNLPRKKSDIKNYSDEEWKQI